MRRSTDRILTTHTGSLPRPADVMESERGVERAVHEVVARQVELGIDVVNDGEASKSSYLHYVVQRLEGFGDVPSSGAGMAGAADLLDFPAYAELYLATQARAVMTGARRPACTGPVSYAKLGPLERDLRNLRAAVDAAGGVEQAFLTAASPGIVSVSLENRHYDTTEAYLWALAGAMRAEYEAIHRAGFLLQVDCPDLALGRHMRFASKTLEEYRELIALHVKVLDHALSGIPAESLRMHLCWGNYAGPHHRDVPLADILDIVLRARPAGLVLESSNPRHAHEWAIFRDVKLPEGKVLIPGVVESSSPYIEHPEVVAQRIERFASVVGRENVIAGTDCGFETVAGFTPIHPDLVWAKLGSLVEGARLASERLW